MVKKSICYALLLLFTPFMLLADQLNDILQTRLIKVAVYDNSYPFSYLDARSNTLMGFNIDMAKQIADKLGIKCQFVTTKIDNRIGLLNNNKVNLVIANLTITSERERLVDFSLPYFVSGQKFISHKGELTKAADLNELRVGVNSGSSGAEFLSQNYPKITLAYYDGLFFAFAALRNGNVQAVSDDDANLIGFFARLPASQRSNFEISSFSITQEFQAIGIKKGQQQLLDRVNQILLEMEKNGEALIIYNRWFGSQTDTAITRGNFKIGQR